jgi:uncharacterized protein (DUF169 family)
MMTDWGSLEDRIAKCVRLSRRPVAITFLDRPPEGVTKFAGSEPSGCSFWRLAAEGRNFYTVPSDHFNCAVGSYTHSIDLSPERASETTQTFELMFRVNYIRPEEVAGIPRLPKAPAAIVYSALGIATVAPSVVLFACRPASAMLFHEATIRAGKSGALPTLGRPTCMALPAALTHGTVTSLGCIGNRVYTGLKEDDLYIAVPGTDLFEVAEALEVIASANAELSAYAQGRYAQLSTSSQPERARTHN